MYGDREALREEVKEVKPLGFNDWAVVAVKLNDVAGEIRRQPRDKNLLKMKFDKMVNTKNNLLATRISHLMSDSGNALRLRSFQMRTHVLLDILRRHVKNNCYNDILLYII